MSDSVTPESVQTPSALREFLTLLDKQVADATRVIEGSPDQSVLLATSVRCRGLHWAITRVADILASQEARIADLERRTVKAVEVEQD